MTIEGFVAQLKDANQKEILGSLLRRLEESVREMGYDTFADAMTSETIGFGPEAIVAHSPINIIPGEGHGACCSIVLAITRGAKGKLGFNPVMRQLREHLIHCQGITTCAVVLCDQWSAKALDEHLGDLRAHHARGVRILFLLSGYPGRQLTPVAVDLAATP